MYCAAFDHVVPVVFVQTEQEPRLDERLPGNWSCDHQIVCETPAQKADHVVVETGEEDDLTVEFRASSREHHDGMRGERIATGGLQCHHCADTDIGDDARATVVHQVHGRAPLCKEADTSVPEPEQCAGAGEKIVVGVD